MNLYQKTNTFRNSQIFLAGSAYKHIGNVVKNINFLDSVRSTFNQTLHVLSYGLNLEFPTC